MIQNLHGVAALSILLMLGSYGMTGPAGELRIRNPNASGDTTVVMANGRTEAREWLIVNDGVMGGVSSSRIWLNEEGSAVFEGQLSLENNGGFASARTLLTDLDLSMAKAVVLRVKGDGRPYQLRFRTDERVDGVAYRALFTTKAGEWTTVELPFEDFSATYRGRAVSGAGPLNPALIRQLIFLIADAREGSFRLEIDWVKAY
jgi:monofunctional biosynthetic peptidoglycan transglycosylase